LPVRPLGAVPHFKKTEKLSYLGMLTVHACVCQQYESFTEHISISTNPMTQNSKKLLSDATLSLCYPVNEEVPQLRRQFVGVGSGEARKGSLERKFARHGTFHCYAPLLRGRCPNNGKKMTLSHSGK
jgi:hypothetical protein